MLDSMSTEQADAVMAALPPNVAERVAEDVENAEVRARAAARAVVHLESSALRGAGATACVAGERATLVLDSANPGGGKLSRGGAVVRCVLYPLEAIKDSSVSKNNASGESNIQYARIRGASVEAEVTDAGTGSYEISYRLVRAGAYDAELTTAGQSRSFRVTCVAGPLHPESCVVERPDARAKPWRAGEVLEVTVRCRDRFGNDVRPPTSAEAEAATAAGGAVLVVVADGEGPGMVEADVGPVADADASDPPRTARRSRGSRRRRLGRTSSGFSPPRRSGGGGAGCRATVFPGRRFG